MQDVLYYFPLERSQKRQGGKGKEMIPDLKLLGRIQDPLHRWLDIATVAAAVVLLGVVCFLIIDVATK